jgi:hypothetical protein
MKSCRLFFLSVVAHRIEVGMLGFSLRFGAGYKVILAGLVPVVNGGGVTSVIKLWGQETISVHMVSPFFTVFF